MKTEVVHGRTPQGQLLYDLAFVNLTDKYLARKHRFPVRTIREFREIPAMRQLRATIAKDRAQKAGAD